MATLYDQWLSSGGDRFQKMEQIKQLADQRNKAQLESALKKKDEESKKGNLLTSLLPTGGGVAGALGGAAAGAAAGSVLPGVGTAIGGLLGAVLGGAGGSALGKVGENAVVGEEDLGKGVGEEAFWGGVTSVPFLAGGKVIKAGAKAATGAGKDAVLQSLKEAGAGTIPRRASSLRDAAAADIASTATNPSGSALNRLSDWGMDTQRRVANTGRVADSFTQEKSLVDTLNRNGLTGSATNMYKQLDGRLGELSSDIQTKLAAIKTTVPRTDALQSLRSNAAKTLPSDLSYEKELTRSLERLSKDGKGDISPSELFGFKQELGNRLSPAFDKLRRGAPLNIKEEADMALWRSIDSDISRLAPEVKNLTVDQSQLINMRPALQQQAGKTAGIPILGVKSQKLEQLKQATQNRIGQKAAGVNTAASGLPGQTIPGTLVRQSIGNIPNAMNVEAPVQQNEVMPQDQEIAQLEAELALNELPEAQSTGMEFSDEELAQGMINALAAGDTKAFDQLKDLYSVLSTMRKSQASQQEKPLSAEASKTVGNANTGLTSLAQLQNIIESQGGKVSPATLIPFRDALGGLGANTLGTASYDAATKNIADVITRLRTGAAITPAEESHYLSMLPQAFDSPDVINQKLQMFNDLFSSVSSRTGSSTSLEDALANL